MFCVLLPSTVPFPGHGLLNRQGQLSYRLSHLLDLSGCFLTLLFNFFLYPVFLINSKLVLKTKSIQVTYFWLECIVRDVGCFTFHHIRKQYLVSPPIVMPVLNPPDYGHDSMNPQFHSQIFFLHGKKSALCGVTYVLSCNMLGQFSRSCDGFNINDNSSQVTFYHLCTSCT